MDSLPTHIEYPAVRKAVEVLAKAHEAVAEEQAALTAAAVARNDEQVGRSKTRIAALREQIRSAELGVTIAIRDGREDWLARSEKAEAEALKVALDALAAFREKHDELSTRVAITRWLRNYDRRPGFKDAGLSVAPLLKKRGDSPVYTAEIFASLDEQLAQIEVLPPVELKAA